MGGASDDRAVEAALGDACTVAASAARQVDEEARFPAEAVGALRAAGLLAASLDPDDGGRGWSLAALAGAARALAGACSSTGLIWAMQHSQLLAVARHSSDSPDGRATRGQLAEQGALVASVASEAATGGSFLDGTDLIEPGPGGAGLHVAKGGATVSYGAHADAFLISGRMPTEPGGDGPAGEVHALLAWRAECSVTPTGGWRALGMRGTASEPMAIDATVPADRLLTDPFTVVLRRTMTPVAHVLWASCWIGIADAAVATGRRALRHRGSGAAARRARLSDAAGRVEAARAMVEQGCARYDRPGPTVAGPVAEMRSAAWHNELKIQVADLTSGAVLDVLRVVGLAGYLEDSDVSVTRHVRDVLSAPLMVSNLRLRDINAELDQAFGGRRPEA